MGERNWEILSKGVFSEIVGIEHEHTIHSHNLQVVWCSADATPSCIGGINWRTKGFFVTDPQPFIAPVLPGNRTSGHISEIAYLVDVMRTAIWRADDHSLIVCGVTDNT